MTKEDTDGAPPEPPPGLPFWLELTMTQAGGWLGRVGQQSLVGRFCSQFTTSGELTDATVSILSRDNTGAWQAYEHPVMLESAAAIATLVRSLGMPTRKPDVEEVYDTSNVWTHLSLRVNENDQAMQLDLPMQCSGFQGNDADALRRLFHAVFSAAGFADFDRSVFGEPGKPTPPPRWCSHCGHDVGTERYSDDDDVLCANDACGGTLLRRNATCQPVRCGHIAPIGAKHCWHCGAATAAS